MKPNQKQIWLREQNRLRACKFCQHKIEIAETQDMCGYNPLNRTPTPLKEIAQSRSHTGFCGPEAKYLSIEGAPPL